MNPLTSRITHSLLYLYAMCQNTFVLTCLTNLPLGTQQKESTENAIDSVLYEGNPPACLVKLVRVATNGAPVMLGDAHSGVIALTMKDNNRNYPEFSPIHCVVHREHLAAK